MRLRRHALRLALVALLAWGLTIAAQHGGPLPGAN